MPRLAPRLFRRARAIDPLLPSLLPACRDLESARLELRWLRDHALEIVKSQPRDVRARQYQRWLRRSCAERGRGRPLQYVLGTEFFGDLEIQCRPGVLIPRGDTASLVSYLADTLRKPRGSGSTALLRDMLSYQDGRVPSSANARPLQILDACTGTGCMALLFHHLLEREDVELRLLGIDISPQAVSLARLNARQLLPPHRQSGFHAVRGDVLEMDGSSGSKQPERAPSMMQVLDEAGLSQVDVLLSNPPYISPRGFRHATTRSVRNFEPKLALVPPPIDWSDPGSDTARGDLFYPRLLDLAGQTRAKVVLFEVADLDQAVRIASFAQARGKWPTVEIWRDQPDTGEADSLDGFRVRGSGHGRGVFLCSIA